MISDQAAIGFATRQRLIENLSATDHGRDCDGLAIC